MSYAILFPLDYALYSFLTCVAFTGPSLMHVYEHLLSTILFCILKKVALVSGPESGFSFSSKLAVTYSAASLSVHIFRRRPL